MRRRRALALVSAAAVVVAVPVATGHASSPPSQSVTVSGQAGQNKTLTWTGSIPPGSNPDSTCSTAAATGTNPTADNHDINVIVPNGYGSVSASFTFSINWMPSSPDETTSDEILTVVDSKGNVVGSSDGSSTTETVAANNLSAGVYHVLACGFTNAVLQPYDGKLVLKTAAGSGETSIPPGAANGLAFSAAVPSDPQRDEAEPLIETAPDGHTYTCGPTGFSSASDYAQVSTDGGDQFHLLGTPPRGQQAIGGGGDCAINLAKDKNTLGNYQYAYAGLGPLTGFTTSTSADNGHTLASFGPADNGLQTTGVLADRQWNVFTDATTALLSYNQQEPRNIVVQKSTDGGLTYGPITAIGGANPDFPGPMRTLPSQFNQNGARVVFFAWNAGSNVNLSVSYDQGATFQDCIAAIDPGQPSAGFPTADSDNAGNIYIAYADKAKFHTHLVTLPHSKLAGCNQPVTTGNTNLAIDAVPPKNNPQDVGFSSPLQVDRGAIRTTVFPWVAAGGAPGHVAVTFYGTPTDGDPNQGSFKASWNVYVNESVNALSPSRNVSQVKATSHPMHYDSICLLGLGCTVSGGDRSLADFFAIKTNPATGRLQVVFNDDAKIPGEAAGHVATPLVVTQIGGPNILGGAKISGGNRPVVRRSSTDPTGDALANYSGLFMPGTTINEPATDFTATAISKPAKGSGFTVTMTLDSLNTTDLAAALAATNSQSLIYALRFTNGFQPSAVTARYSVANGWTFKYNDYDTLLGECNAPPQTGDDKCLAFGVTGKPVKGTVSGNTITITVPVNYASGNPLLRALTGSQGAGQRPHLTRATTGSRFYDASVFSFGDAAVDDTVKGTPQTYLYPLDNTPAMDFLLP